MMIVTELKSERDKFNPARTGDAIWSGGTIPFRAGPSDTGRGGKFEG